MALEEQMSLFNIESVETGSKQIEKPSSYTGLSGFHKYWGKKPLEPLSFLIDLLTKENDIILDPFLGGGLLSRLSLKKNRRFIGIDINPASIELGTLFINLPSYREYENNLKTLQKECSKNINDSYKRSDGTIASHYLWSHEELQSVWIKHSSSISEFAPTNFDFEQIESFNNYKSRNLRDLALFNNSRINSRSITNVNDLFTQRALRNIDILLDHILTLPALLRRAFLLTLTSASGQMSKMVFAISKRGKNNGHTNEKNKIEVGSWAIGLWCPDKHFEINVWNCFYNRANKFLKALRILDYSKPISPSSIDNFFINSDRIALCLDAAQNAMQSIPSKSISLIITDPPHSDRIPYLELSEFWNSILQYPNSDYDNEIVISNARERNKNRTLYIIQMQQIMKEFERIIQDDGYICVQFNARDNESWKFLDKSNGLVYRGCFPLEYSAASIVQDNRKGAMKNDFILIFQSKGSRNQITKFIDIPNWSSDFPQKET